MRKVPRVKLQVYEASGQKRVKLKTLIHLTDIRKSILKP
uniref:Uncharacterized protein n=1 Tax=Vibrio splendidus TaxID=29497 RepID=A0A0H3ZMU9_VIBSP|nr:hypothetical protein [Vibrio splendidus]